MRTEWVMGSAAMLVVGGFAVTFGFGILPLPNDQGLAAALLVAAQSPGRWLASCVLIFVAAITMTLGAFAPLPLLRRDRRFAVVAVGVFATGTIGMCGYATMLGFLRSLILNNQLEPSALDEIADDPGAMAFALAWQVFFLLGLLLIAIGLFRGSDTPRWVPSLMVVFVVSQFIPVPADYYLKLMQWAALACAFVGIARAARIYAHNREVEKVLSRGAPDAHAGGRITWSGS